jgi:regulator of protease activity HflC (stomatin/prohibitin superfamily)
MCSAVAYVLAPMRLATVRARLTSIGGAVRIDGALTRGRQLKTDATVVCVATGALALTLLMSAVKVVPDYERVVVHRRGRGAQARGPGLILVIPVLDSPRTVDLRTTVLEVPVQRGRTRDGVTVDASLMVVYRVVDPEQAAAQVVGYRSVIMLIAQMFLARMVAEFDLRFWLTERDVTLAILEHGIRRHSMQHGFEVTAVRLLDVRTALRDDDLQYPEFGNERRRADRPLIA